MVNLLLNIFHFQRTNNWEEYINAIRKFLPYCFSCNRHSYTRNLSYYYIQMKDLASAHPSAQIFLKEEGFTVSVTGKSYSKTPVDQFIEMTINRSSKETGGLTGKTENPVACARWTKINHFLVSIREHQNKILRNNRNERHTELGEKRILKDEIEFQILLQMLETWVPNLWEDNQPLISISTGAKASTDFIENFKTIYDRGTVEMNEFFKHIIEKMKKKEIFLKSLIIIQLKSKSL